MPSAVFVKAAPMRPEMTFQFESIHVVNAREPAKRLYMRLSRP